MTVLVHYNPTNPNQSQISSMSSKAVLGVILLILFLVLLAWGSVYIIYKYKSIAAFTGFKSLFN